MIPRATNEKESPRQQFIASKIKKIKEEGIRGKPVPNKQAVAVAYSYADKRGGAPAHS